MVFFGREPRTVSSAKKRCLPCCLHFWHLKQSFLQKEVAFLGPSFGKRTKTGLGEGDGLGGGDGFGAGNGLGKGDGVGEGDGLGDGDGFGAGDGLGDAQCDTTNYLQAVVGTADIKRGIEGGIE